MISDFLLANQAKIKDTSLIAEQLELELHTTVSLAEAIILFADLVNGCNPKAAHLDSTNPYRIRLEFDERSRSPA